MRVFKHPRLLIVFILVACLGPFLNKPIQTDDYLFVRAAQWIQTHPFNFYGFDVNWQASAVPMTVENCNPPLLSYYLAVIGAWFGWSEIVLHLALLPVAIAAALGIYALAARWCERPLLATIVALLTPAFLVSSSTLMCDVPMLALCIWAVVWWERALESGERRAESGELDDCASPPLHFNPLSSEAPAEEDQPSTPRPPAAQWRRVNPQPNQSWLFLGAGALAGLAILTKYSAITVLPLLFILAALRRRQAGWWLAGLAVPLIMLAAFELVTAKMYGYGLFSSASNFARAHRPEYPGGWLANTIIGLAFTGGSLLPLMFFAAALWQRKVLAAGIISVLGLTLAFHRFWGGFGLVTVPNPQTLRTWEFTGQIAFWTVAGLHVLLLATLEAREALKTRSLVSLMLVLWILDGLFFAAVLNWTINARSLLLVVPPAAILLVRRLEAARQQSDGNLWPIIPLLLAAAVTGYVNLADYQMGRLLRQAALDIAAKYQSPGRKIWFEHHGTFQYYLEEVGAQPLDIGQSLLQRGDIVVVPRILYPFIALPAGSVQLIDYLQYPSHSRVTLTVGARRGAAGFYVGAYGPVPFAFGDSPSQGFSIARMATTIQLHSVPANPDEVNQGALPIFHAPLAYSEEDKSSLATWMAAEMEQCRTAEPPAGNETEAGTIQGYRQVLVINVTNAVALNNLAWILATTSNPGLRDGAGAVRLAKQAVALTDQRLPQFIGTLGAAEAGVGDFTNAVQSATLAQRLATLTGQNDMAQRNAALAQLYAQGKTAEMLEGP